MVERSTIFFLLAVVGSELSGELGVCVPRNQPYVSVSFRASKVAIP